MKRTEESPFVRFVSPEIILSDAATFELALSAQVWKKDISLVIDVYDLDNPVHPEGHIGWWKFSGDRLQEHLQASIENIDSENVQITLNQAASQESWVNEETVFFKRLVFNAVLRSNVTNAIVYIDKVPAFKGVEEAAEFRSVFDRNWEQPRLAYLSYVFPKSSTVRLVSRNIFPYDAVGNLCLDVYRLLRQNKIAVEMYAENTDIALNDIVHKEELLYESVSADDQVLYFFSTYDPNIPKIASLENVRRIVYFHGITAPAKLQVFDPELSAVCEKGKTQLKQLRLFDAIATNSRANSNYIIAHTEKKHKKKKARSMQVIPPKLISPDTAQRSLTADPCVNSTTRLLYVGRIKSHKKVEHVLELFAEYLKLDAAAECWIVGGGADKAYWDYLMWVEKTRLQLSPDKVYWVGNVDEDKLRDLYRSASVYVSMSEDEGFCLPVLESMLNGVPLFVYGLPPIKEIIQDSGLYFENKDFEHLAQTLHLLLSNQQRCDDIIERQRQRAVPIIERMDGRDFLSLLQPPSL
ncbi:MAG: glycosyltransferase family 4 protein [Phormidesmis sp.]